VFVFGVSRLELYKMAFHDFSKEIFPPRMMRKESFSTAARMEVIAKANQLIQFIDTVMMDSLSVKEHLMNSLTENVDTIRRLFLGDDNEEEDCR
jgi:hypothetical protein